MREEKGVERRKGSRFIYLITAINRAFYYINIRWSSLMAKDRERRGLRDNSKVGEGTTEETASQKPQNLGLGEDKEREI